MDNGLAVRCMFKLNSRLRKILSKDCGEPKLACDRLVDELELEHVSSFVG